MKINIVCNDTGWIYEEFVYQLKKHSKNTIHLNSNEKCDVTHYLPYYETPKHPLHPCTAWFSHQESHNPLHDRFIQAAKKVDVAISHSKKYADLLKSENVKVIQIMPGVDLDRFSLRILPPKSDKLIVGYVGRQYESNRKNPQLLKRIAKLPFVDFRATNGKLIKEQIPGFYSNMHIIISPAIIEGGPMCILEALAMGIVVVCMKGVGVADEFDVGIIKANNNDHFIEILKKVYENKLYLRNTMTMDRMRAQIRPWKQFVEEHDKVWNSLR